MFLILHDSLSNFTDKKYFPNLRQLLEITVA